MPGLLGNLVTLFRVKPSSFPLIFSCVAGILVAGATERRYGQAYWNLPDLSIIESGGTRSHCAAFSGGFALIISQTGISIPGNTFSGGKPHLLA